jgi:hypothetical protein
MTFLSQVCSPARSHRPSAAAAAVCCLVVMIASAAGAEPRYVAPGTDGRLIYDVDARGNRVPDFSHCGYAGGGVAIPDVPVCVRVPAAAGDAGPRIQAALDYVAGLPADEHGYRGAVLVQAGRHEIAGCLRITAGGVVLRGQGQGPDGTALVATGTDRRALVQVAGKNDRRVTSTPVAVADEYVPVGARRLRLKSTDGLHVGDTVLVEHPSTARWLSALGMDRFSGKDGGWLSWRPGAMDVRWDRTVIAIDGDVITLDAPLTMALDATLATARVSAYVWPGRHARVGVENLRCESAYDARNPKDEEHAWIAVTLDAARDAWVRQVSAVHFVSSAVQVGDGCKGVTVEDCQSLEPVSENAAYRRHAFYTAGQLTLVQRCRSEHGRHDFAAGYLAAGPNAFVDCEAVDASGFSGPIESWATGVLYDSITMDGGGLALTNREIAGQGVGWAAANCVFWQCTAPVVTCRNPPTARNWAIGCWGQFVGDGQFRSCNEFVKPESLYRGQLADRLGGSAVARLNRRAIPAAADSAPPALANPGRQAGGAGADTPGLTAGVRRGGSDTLALQNGWLACDGALLAGGRAATAWWRGSVVPGRRGEFGPAVTRFAPGRTGPAATDDLDALTDTLKAGHKAVFEYHYGLWYDQRRDDHQMVRRIDGEVWPPFFEQPWARSGVGTAWDGLSKYDLTKFNPWYFARLKQLAGLCDHKGLVLVHQMYFQHNVLEAGAHWADCPWRPANCLQATGFPEPPPYVNKKRVFMAEAFYDVTHPVRRELHRAYIRHCLEALADHPNVVHLTSGEYTGPLEFVQLWLDTVREWQAETGKRVLVGLSCTKDVQDAILADPARAAAVNVIDLRYWWYTGNGSLYAPKGGQNLAPRQHLREWKADRSMSAAATARQVREYRDRCPDKAILCSLDRADGWAVLAAGGSAPNLPASIDGRLLAAVPRMRPFEPAGLGAGQYALADVGRDYLVYAAGGGRVKLDLSADPSSYVARRVNLRTGRCEAAAEPVSGGRAVDLAPTGSGAWAVWLTRDS